VTQEEYDQLQRNHPELFQSRLVHPHLAHLVAKADHISGPPPTAEHQPPVRNEPVGPKAGEAGNPTRVHVSVTSIRTRLCDPDNLCPKYFIDCLRYAELIPNDRPQDITLSVSQEKCAHIDEERTIIELTYP
jgi:hypothetical protein